MAMMEPTPSEIETKHTIVALSPHFAIGTSRTVMSLCSLSVLNEIMLTKCTAQCVNN